MLTCGFSFCGLAVFLKMQYILRNHWIYSGVKSSILCYFLTILCLILICSFVVTVPVVIVCWSCEYWYDVSVLTLQDSPKDEDKDKEDHGEEDQSTVMVQ